jgi:hypothetical protein
MTINLKSAMHAAALAESLGDTEARASGVLSNTRPTTSRIRRRRAARRAGVGAMSVATVAAVAVGGGVVRSHNAPGATPTRTAPGLVPSTALSRRAGVECGKPFDPTVKSDPRFAAASVQAFDSDGVHLPFDVTVTEANDPRPTTKGKVSPTTAVVLANGVVVGIAPASDDPLAGFPTTWPRSTGDSTGSTNTTYLVPITQTTNCLGSVPPTVWDDMFEVAFLLDYAMPGESQTALVISEPTKAPRQNLEPTPQPGPPGWVIFTPSSLSGADGGYLAFKAEDYRRAKDDAGARIPLYRAPEAGVDPASLPYTGPVEAHASGVGRLIITENGVVEAEIAEEDIPE